MSHIVEIKTEVRDVAAMRAACQRLGLDAPMHGFAQLFGDTATGLVVQLPGWRYPAVFDTQSGQARYDNYNGHWGEPAELDKCLQAYACEKTKIEARRKGYTCTEQRLADGSIKLTVNVGGAA